MIYIVEVVNSDLILKIHSLVNNTSQHIHTSISKDITYNQIQILYTKSSSFSQIVYFCVSYSYRLMHQMRYDVRWILQFSFIGSHLSNAYAYDLPCPDSLPKVGLTPSIVALIVLCVGLFSYYMLCLKF